MAYNVGLNKTPASSLSFHYLSLYPHTIIITDGECANSSQLLKHVNITFSVATAVVNCEFREAYPQASCVLVYREYDSPLLRVLEFSQFSNFPVTIAVDNPENYTFAVFGKDSVRGMEYEPIVCAKYDGKAAVTGIPQTTKSI